MSGQPPSNGTGAAAGLTVSSAASTSSSPSVSGNTTILTGAQATQILKRLRTMGAAGENQTIKIQAVQTNPATGVRQIIAIPIQHAQRKIAVSPMKTGAQQQQQPRLQVVQQQQQPPQVVGTTTTSAGLGTVKVVKLSDAGALSVAAEQSQQILTPSKSQQQRLNVSTTPTPNSRKRSDIDFDSFSSDAKRRKTEKGGKGLRHFSMKVCEKVQAKGSTSYNEVADELVSELTDPRCTSPTDQQYDQKNIRRRVYDALNVLMAMNIISKEKKEIRWLGLPTNSVQEANSLEVEKARKMERIKAKTQQLQDLILQQIAFKNLVERNKERERAEGPPAPNSAIQLPFIIVNTSKKTVIDCSISNDKMEYLFNFDDTFEIHDDMEVLKRMGLGFGLEHGQVSEEDLSKARAMVPRALEQYVTQLAETGSCAGSGMPKVTRPVTVAVAAAANSAQLASLKEESDSDVDIS